MCGSTRSAAVIAALAVIASKVSIAQEQFDATQAEDYAGQLRQRAQIAAQFGLEAPAGFLAAADADDAFDKASAEASLVAAKVLQQVIEYDGYVSSELVNDLIRVTNSHQAANDAFDAAVEASDAAIEASAATVQ